MKPKNWCKNIDYTNKLLDINKLDKEQHTITDTENLGKSG